MNAAEFPIGWATFDPALRMADGFTHFVVVDDYTDYSLWDLLMEAVPEFGSRPKGKSWAELFPQLPEGNWMFLHVMHSMATDGLYAKGGITKPEFEQLPAVYAIQHGKKVGKYVMNADKGTALEFIKAQLAAA